jgi:hypothetical protein
MDAGGLRMNQIERDTLIQYALNDFMLRLGVITHIPPVLEVTEIDALRLCWKVRTEIFNQVLNFYITVPTDGPAEAFLPAADTVTFLLNLFRGMFKEHEASYPHSIGL